LVRDRNGVFEVAGHAAIFGHGGPIVFEYLYVRGPGVYHGFNRDDKAGFQAFPTTRVAVVRHLRVFVHLAANPVADELADHRIVA
jgi:hypothetical protein